MSLQLVLHEVLPVEVFYIELEIECLSCGAPILLHEIEALWLRVLQLGLPVVETFALKEVFRWGQQLQEEVML